MQQVEWNIPSDVWGGLNTKYDPTTKSVLPNEATTSSANYDLSPTGNLIKRNKTSIYNASALSSPIKDEFEMIFENGTRHKLVMSNGTLYYTNGNGVFNSVHSGYVAAGNMEFAGIQNRVYYGNGIDQPQVYDMGTSYGGVTYTPPTVAPAGVTAPSTNLTAGSPTSGGSVPDGAHTYKYTFLYYDSQESNGSAVSATQTCSAGNNTVPLSSIDVGGLGVTARKIYRDNNDGNWVLVGTIANNTATTFSDTVILGTTPIPSDNNTPPLWSLVTAFRDRLWVAGVAASQSTLYYSDAGLPDVWPTNNFIECNGKDTITAVTSFNDKIVIFGKSSFGIILGSTSDDFRYIDISPTIGCTDCRSIQTITVRGVPKLQWLSQFGVYQWDGSNIQLISDKIENLLRFNIQQAQGSFNKNIQTTQEDFLGGTYTPGIDIMSEPGSISVRGYMEAGDSNTLLDDPTKLWDTKEEWDNGSSITNIATEDGTNTLKAVLSFYPLISTNTLSNLDVSGIPSNPSSTVHIPTATNVTGENKTVGGGSKVSEPTHANPAKWAQPIVLPRAGTINAVSLLIGNNNTNRLVIWGDASGVPGAVLFTGSSSVATNLSETPSLSVAAGRYWIGAEESYSISGTFTQLSCRTDGQFTLSGGANPLQNLGGGWTGFSASAFTGGGTATALKMSFTFTQTAVSASGSMTSPVFDTVSQFAKNPIFSQTVVVQAGTRIVTTIYAADDAALSTNLVTQVFDSDVSIPPFSNTTLSLANKRYWRMVSVLTTNDDRTSTTATRSLLNFYGNSTWISEAIDHTTDITTLDDLLMVSTIPSGTSASVSIATSNDNITYTAYTSVVAAVPKRYSKVKVVLATDIAGTVSPTVSTVRLNWTVVSTFTSSAITTILTPVQWGAFQTDFDTNSGTAVFQTRSATTQGGLSVAGWTTVTNGAIIPSSLNLWVQWRVTLTASVSQVPEVRSVVINWLVVNSTGLRVASLFYNQVYYLAAADFNSSTNNTVLYYDKEGRWGQYTNLQINTMGLFFGQAFYGDSLVGNYLRWLDPTITSSQTIAVDFRTKAYSSELVADDKTKTLRHAVVDMEDTSAAIRLYYSVDEGRTWLSTVDIVTGFNVYTGSNTGNKVKVRFVPESGSIQWGYSLMLRVYNNDQYPINVAGIRAKAYVSERPVLVR